MGTDKYVLIFQKVVVIELIYANDCTSTLLVTRSAECIPDELYMDLHGLIWFEAGAGVQDNELPLLVVPDPHQGQVHPSLLHPYSLLLDVRVHTV